MCDASLRMFESQDGCVYLGMSYLVKPEGECNAKCHKRMGIVLNVIKG